jgi:dTDP-4-dehydrorhamnose 3,5-epimerase
VRSLPTRLQGPLLLEPRVFPDERGFFCETFRASLLSDLGVTEQFVQDNHSRSSRGVVRGMHFHIGAGVSKLVRCSRGEILDVLVDLRRGSPTYGQWEGYNLSDENMHVLYAPIGFGHGFCVLSDIADVLYKQSAYYDPEIERGIALDDPEIGIDWPIPLNERTISDRDTTAPRLSDVADQLPFEYSG